MYNAISLLNVLNTATTEALTIAHQLGHPVLVAYAQTLSQDALQNLTDIIQHVQSQALSMPLPNCPTCDGWPLSASG